MTSCVQLLGVMALNGSKVASLEWGKAEPHFPANISITQIVEERGVPEVEALSGLP